MDAFLFCEVTIGLRSALESMVLCERKEGKTTRREKMKSLREMRTLFIFFGLRGEDVRQAMLKQG
jgi:hypothetical protein